MLGFALYIDGVIFVIFLLFRNAIFVMNINVENSSVACTGEANITNVFCLLMFGSYVFLPLHIICTSIYSVYIYNHFIPSKRIAVIYPQRATLTYSIK
jgi:hypothetical protein